jgi:nicotine blue oxidoreductase
MTVCGIVLAAGAGTRFGGPKAPYEWDGERLVDRAVRTLHEAGCDPVYAILGAWEGAVENCLVIVNHGWEEGMGSSLRIGLKWARAASDADSAVVILVDQPGITPDGVRRVIDTPGSLVQAAYGGRPGHPVRIGKEPWPHMSACWWMSATCATTPISTSVRLNREGAFQAQAP